MRRFVVLLVGIFGLSAQAISHAGEPDPVAEYSADERSHWSLQLRGDPPIPIPPAHADQAWCLNPIDAFVRAKQIEKGLQPAPQADRRVLIRRLFLNLTGLPPALEEVEEFVNDLHVDAYERLIDRLLTSPHYGERWGQHWLDVARFAETEGFEYDRHLPHAWRYRDYVIHAFQSDKPYDQFLREQLAGDEIYRTSKTGPASEVASKPGSNSADIAGVSSASIDDPRVAAGFLRYGPIRRNAGNADVAFSRNEVLTEMTDTVGVAVLGMTVGCARCHDHKFDPIRQVDYYRLQAYFAGVYESEISLADSATQAVWKTETEKLNSEIKRIESALDRVTGDSRRQLQEQLKNTEQQLPPPLPAITSVDNDEHKRTVIHVLKRGDETKPGVMVEPRPPGVLLSPGTSATPRDVRNPRTLLADWIVQPQNPLTARVIVNRIWMLHFGQGLVRTPNDFGVNGDYPSHPELLDYLANEFVRGGWRIKSLHRLILNSQTYRQASHSSFEQSNFQKDPDNRFLWKLSTSRLDAEQIRDSLLSISGVLNSKVGGPSVIVPVENELVDLLYKPSQWMVTQDPFEHFRRSIYLIKKRNLRLPFMEVFDQPALQGSCSRRESTTHAPQALELLNGTLSNQLASSFAERLEREAGSDKARQVDLAFLLATGRRASDREMELALLFLKTQPLREFALAIFNLNEFLYLK